MTAVIPVTPLRQRAPGLRLDSISAVRKGHQETSDVIADTYAHHQRS